MKIKKGDKAMMLGGKDRGKTGTVLRTDPKAYRVIVEGLNLVKRHKRSSKQNQQGQIVSVERWVAAAGVAVVSRDSGKPARVGWSISEDGSTKTRIDRKTKVQL